MNKKWILIIFAISGTAALVYEITWIRPLSLVFGTTIYAVSTIVASFILGLALGSWFAGKFTDKLKDPLKLFAFIQIGIGVYGVFLLPIFSLLPESYLFLHTLTYPNLPLFTFLQVAMAMAIITIPATMMGTTLPLLMKSYADSFSKIGRDVGKLDASNSIGAVFGTLAAGFLMIPMLGIQNTIIIVAIINVGLGFAILICKKYTPYKFLVVILIPIGLFFVFFPGYDIDSVNYGVFVYHGPDLDYDELSLLNAFESIEFYKESLYSTVIVYSAPNSVSKLSLNGKIQCDTFPQTITGLNNLAKFPYDIYRHNHGEPTNALNIGLGCGITSKWISEKVNTTTIEIDPVITEVTEYFVDTLDHTLVIDDGRNWLFRNNEKFDLIITEPFDPFVNNGAMYTLEYFLLLNEDLTENGIVSQWVPNFEFTEEDFFILFNTFHEVFPYIYIFQMEPNDDSQWVFVGSQKPLDVFDQEYFLYDQDDIGKRTTVLNTDDRPVLEFSVAQNIYK